MECGECVKTASVSDGIVLANAKAASMHKKKRRAQRFFLNLTMRYRMDGEENWHHGGVVNMSCSGVLFHGEVGVKKGTRIDLSIDLPCAANERLGAKIEATGVVVRALGQETSDSGSLLAAQLTRQRIVRR